MLTFEDEPIIRNAMFKRLDKEPGVQIADIKVINQPKATPPHIQVGVWLILTDCITNDSVPDVRAFFDLPNPFDYKQLHNEIDEIAEGCKKAKLQIGVGRTIWMPGLEHKREKLPGTGLRGRWRQHA